MSGTVSKREFLRPRAKAESHGEGPMLMCGDVSAWRPRNHARETLPSQTVAPPNRGWQPPNPRQRASLCWTGSDKAHARPFAPAQAQGVLLIALLRVGKRISGKSLVTWNRLQ